MLEDVPATTQSEETYRLENLRRYLSTLKDLGIDDERIDETLEFLGMVTGQAEPNDSLDYPFEPKPQLNEKLPGGTRYSVRNWGVYYAALEEETAHAEVKHHYLKDVLGEAPSRRTVYYSTIKCRYQGETKDVRPKLQDWPELVSDNYTFCQELGREAMKLGLDGLFAPSARRRDGTNVPVFKGTAVSAAEIISHVAFSIDPNSGDFVAEST